MLRRHEVDQDDLQGNVLCGYGNRFWCARYLFVRLGEPARARRWLREVAAQVTTARPWGGTKPLHTLNVALTWKGLRALGLPDPVLETLPAEFRCGMASRAPLLGDVGDSNPAHWTLRLDGSEQEQASDSAAGGEGHALVTLTAQDLSLLQRQEDLATEQIEMHGGRVVHLERGELFGYEPKELLKERGHFGFADGFSQPAIRGNAGPDNKPGMGTPQKPPRPWAPWRRRWTLVAPGEFVLGYRGEDGQLEPAPAEPLGRSGSFMVVRKLSQDVDAFNRYIDEMAALPGVEEAVNRDLAGVDPAHLGCESDLPQRWLKAKLVGRWPDGRSLVKDMAPERPEMRVTPDYSKDINLFRYDEDWDGHKCPLGAHARRANPRDAFGWEGRLTRRHRIIRRSMTYGPHTRDHETAKTRSGRFARARDARDRSSGDASEQGLMFICFQASIERQFELIQGRWLNDGDAFWLGREKDFMASPNGSPNTTQAAGADGAAAPNGDADATAGGDVLTIQGDPPLFLPAPAKPFVTTRGGEYFFAPGLTALRALAAGYWL